LHDLEIKFYKFYKCETKMAFVTKARLVGCGLGHVQKSFFCSTAVMSKKIEEVVIIGGGLMGAGIAQVTGPFLTSPLAPRGELHP
jgi:hypothetical protein